MGEMKTGAKIKEITGQGKVFGAKHDGNGGKGKIRKHKTGQNILVVAKLR